MGLEPPCPHRDSRSNRALAHSVTYMWQPSPGARFLCPLLAFCAKHSTGGAAAEALTPDASPGAQGLALCLLLSPRARPGGQRRTAGTSAGDSVLAQVWETRPTFLWSCGHTGQLAEATARTQRGSHGAGGTGSLPQESVTQATTAGGLDVRCYQGWHFFHGNHPEMTPTSGEPPTLPSNITGVLPLRY